MKLLGRLGWSFVLGGAASSVACDSPRPAHTVAEEPIRAPSGSASTPNSAPGPHEPEPAPWGAPQAAATHPLLGQVAPPIVLQALAGKRSIVHKPGRVTVVHFWATWCEPCKKAFPLLQALYAKYKKEGLDVVAPSGDDTIAGVDAFVKKYKATFVVGWDRDHIVAKQWSPPNMPCTYIVDKANVVRFVHIGYHAGEEVEIEAEVKTLL